MANPRTIARLQERIKERAAYCLQFELNDPRATFLTITRVELAHDFSHAKVFYSVLGDDSDRKLAAHMLKSAGGFIQRQVARVLETRRVPHLTWIFDGSTQQAAEMDRLIREARERDRAINPALGPENEFVKPREDQPSPADLAADTPAEDDAADVEFADVEDDEDAGEADADDPDVGESEVE
jgi:ribosome-binding factor A